ncbi:uncharacterized protein BO80DRAFT_474517, partial [Aspergillus ibericus CBS 121593]
EPLAALDAESATAHTRSSTAAALHPSCNHLFILAEVFEFSTKMRAKWRKKRKINDSPTPSQLFM